MASKIKAFRNDAEFDGKKGTFDFKKAELELLKEFDTWREREKPAILAIDFGRKHGIYIEDSPHYWYIRVLYEDTKE